MTEKIELLYYAGTIEISKEISLEVREDIMTWWKKRFSENMDWISLFTRDGGRDCNRIEFVFAFTNNKVRTDACGLREAREAREADYEHIGRIMIQNLIVSFGLSKNGAPNFVPRWSMSTVEKMM